MRINKKIKDKTAKIGVIGLGYVGLPLAIEFVQAGFDVIGMTNLGEARCAREAEISYATLAMVTDYDCRKEEEKPVSVETVIACLQANASSAKNIIRKAIPTIPESAAWPSHKALDNAIMTQRSTWPKETIEKLEPIIRRFI